MRPPITTDVLVIGGGATGTGVLRDLAMRGIRALLVEKGDLAHGTTGRYHGLLHSGGRYAVNDPHSARDCAAENAILRRIIPHCLEDTGGLFVVTPWDDPAYGDRFAAGCRDNGVPVEEIAVAEALRREPRLHPGIMRAFAVADAAADSFLTVQANAASAREYGAELCTYHRVACLLVDGTTVRGARLCDLRNGEEWDVEAAMVVNAAGAWAGRVAAMAGADLTIVAGKGTMLAMNHRLINTVLNRCKLPDDGDIIVPIHTVCVIGTTDIAVPDPDTYSSTPDEIALMLEEGDKLVPGIRRARVLRAWAGVRPLYQDRVDGYDRAITRDYKLLDHRELNGIEGFVSIVGGKYTTYRLMAERTVDMVARRLGVETPCRTHLEPVPGSRDGKLYTLGEPLAEIERTGGQGALVCECELATRDRVVADLQAVETANIDDVRRAVRLGMGPCQGGFCTYRAAALLLEARGAAVSSANEALHHFLHERWRGLLPVLRRDQIKQAQLDRLIYQTVLNADHLPRARAGRELVTDEALYMSPEVAESMAR